MSMRRAGCTVVAACAWLAAGLGRSDAGGTPSYGPPVRSSFHQTLPLPIATAVPLQSFAVAFGTRSWAVGDVDGDGRDDIVVAPTYGRYLPLMPLQIWRNEGGGRFVDRTADLIEGPVTVVNSAQGILIADVNGDGRPDIVIVESGVEDTAGNVRGGQILTLLSQPSGRLADRSAAAVASDGTFHNLAAFADVNGDGAIDIVLTRPCQMGFAGCGVIFYLNDGTGHFAPSTAGLPQSIAYFPFPPPPAPWCCPSFPFQNPGAVGAADLDGDGRADLITGTGAGGDDFDNALQPRTIRVHRQRPDGTFEERARLPIPVAIENVGYTTESRFAANPPAGLVALEIVVADLNGDGRPDLVVLWEGVASHLTIYRNDGDFQFTDVTLAWFGRYETGRGSRNVGLQRLVDVNGDGVPDLVLGTAARAHPASDFVTRSFIFLNDGTGRLTPWTLRVNGQLPAASALDAMLGCEPVAGPSGPCATTYMPLLLDANGDGRADVVLVNSRDTLASPVREDTMFVHTFLALEPATLAFEKAAYEGTEGTSVMLNVIRAGDATGPTTVRYAAVNQTATAGQDYTLAPGTLSFAAGITSRTITIPLTNDTLVEGSETFQVVLSDPTGNAVLGGPATTTVTILDNDVAGTVRFTAPAFTAAESGNATVMLQRTGGAGSGVMVTFRTVDGSARAGTDYEARNGSVTFGAGEMGRPILVPVKPNQSVDGDRTFTVELLSITPASGILGAPSTASVTIKDDDVGGVVIFATPAVSVLEGMTATLKLSRSGGSGGNVSVRWTTVDGTAVAGADYPSSTGIVTFEANQMTRDITIATSPDAAIEGDESFRVTLSDPVGLTLGTPASATVTILDGQQGIAFAAAEYTVSEAATNATIAVVRTGPTTGAVSARYSTSPGSAGAGRDYTSIDGIVTFAPGVRAATFTVPIVGDALAETAETVLLTLSEPSPPAGLGRQRTATLRIVDDDAPGVVRLGAATFTVGEAAGTLAVPVQRTGTAAGITVDYATVPGTATAGVDYLVARGTLTFAAGEMLKTFPVAIVNDARDEPNETFTVVLGNVSAPATLGTPASAVVTITDDDVAGVIAFSAVSYMVNEGVPFAVVTVNRTGGAAGGVTVDFATADGTASAGADYTGRALTLTFQPGELSKQVTIPIAADGVREGNETVLLTLSNPGGGATLGTPRAAALTIVDKETGPTVQFAFAAFAVPESVPAAMIMLTRSGSLLPGQTVTLRTTAAGTASPGQFTPIVNQVVPFPANQASVLVPLALAADNAIIDGDRTVVLELVGASAPLSLGAPRTAVLTIRDDDSVFRFTSPTYGVTEGAPATLTVERVGATLTAATVRYVTANGTAAAPGDYTATAAGMLAFAPGVTTQTITIPTAGDTLVEGNETFTVTLTQPVGAALGAPSQAVVTIADNDLPGTVQFGAPTYSVVEGGMAMITVTRTGGLGGPIAVDFATVAGGTATGGAVAGPGIDYITRTVPVTFAAGSGSQTVSVSTVPDTALEGPKTVRLALTVPPGSAAVLGTPAVAELTIFDDEQVRFQFSASSYAAMEGAGKALLTVQRVGPATGSHSVGYTVAGISAAAGQDLDATGGTLVFAPGVTTQPITIPLANDLLSESTESFLVTLVNPVAPAGLGTPSVATVTITDDDAPGTVQFSVAGTAVAEGEAVTLTVVRTGAPGPATVQWSTGGGTATTGQDYVAAGGTLSFAAGETSKTLPPLVTLADSAVEGAEFFEVTLSAPTNLGLGTPAKATVWILDAQQSVQFTEPVISVGEGGAAMVTLLRIGVPAGELRAKVAVGGSAIPDVDYVNLGGLVDVVFPPGVASQTVPIRAANNLTVEPVARVLRLQLVEVTGGTVGTPGAIDIAFVDNDAPDLVVTSVTAPVQSTNGLKTPVTATVRNRTGAPAAASKLGVFLSAASAVPGAGARIGLLDTPALAGGATGTVSGTVTMPPDLAQGMYFVSVIADALNTVIESLENNNGLTAATKLEIVPSLPDLVVTSVGIPGETQTGKSVPTPTTVINAGTVASPPYRVGLFLAKDDPTPGAGILMAMKDMPMLGPGASAAVPLSVAIPEDLSQGQYFISAVADVNGAIVDADRSNNTLVADVPFRVNRNIGGFKTASATLSIAPAAGAPTRPAAASSCFVNQISPSAVTLNLSGSLTVTGQTSNTGQGTTVLKGHIVRSDTGAIVGTGTLTGTFTAVINDSDIATITVNFTLAVVPAGPVPAPPPATGRFTTSGRVDRGELQTTLTSGSIDGCGPLSGTVTFRGTQSFFFSLLFFADGGAFAGSTTPSPSYPLSIDAYSAGVIVLFDTTPARLDQVRFTGPPGSGMSNAQADIRQNFAAGNFYETDTFVLPATSLKGTWFVNYEGATKSFTVAEPEAAQRFVAMLPTVTLDSLLRITRIDWVFKNRLTGATVPAPMNADALQVELDGFDVHRYTSPNFTRGVTTTGPISPPIPVDQVTNLYISYKDTLTGNFYVTSYTRD